MISQALFHAPNGLTRPATLRIEVTHRMMTVEKTLAPWQGLNYEQAVGYDPNKPDEQQNVHVGALDLVIQPFKTSYQWDFPIPFDQVL